MPIINAAFEQCLKFVLTWEGGYTNDPVDPGGATNLGIIQTEYDRWRKAHGLAVQSVKFISMDEARQIYYHEYWEPSFAGAYSYPANLAIFDTAVNMGVGRAKEFRDKAKPTLLTAKELCLAIANQRVTFRYKRVAAKPSQIKFLKGWLNRDHALKVLGK